jgi:hypothetical protein
MIPRTPKSKEPSQTTQEPQGGDARRFTRRSLFGASASAAAAAIVSSPALAQEADNLPPSVPEWQLEPGEETLSKPYGRPSKFEANVVRRYRQGLPEPPTRLSSFSLTPLQDLHGIITRMAFIMSATMPGFQRSIHPSIGSWCMDWSSGRSSSPWRT